MAVDPATAFGHEPLVTVGGSALVPRVASYLEAVTVDLAVGLPSSATLRFRDPDLTILAGARLQVAAPVTVALNPVGEQKHTVLFVGEVTALEYEYDARGALVVARCHDALHKLTRGRRTRSWTAQTEAGVVRAVLAGAGVTPGTIEGADLLHEHVAQLDVSDWDFLTARAREAGRVVLLEQGKVHVRRRPTVAQAGPPVELVVGENLERLRVRVTSAGQVKAVEVDGWDPATQRPVAGKGVTRGTAAKAGVTHARLSATSRTDLHVGSPVLTSAAQARAVAEGLAVRVSDVHAELEGHGDGDPRLRPGVAVQVKGTGPTHDGTYVLTRVQHVSDHLGYRTRLECGGGEDRTLRGTLGATRAAPTGGGNRPVPGVTVGVVTDLKDPARQGRVKVTFPWLSDSYATHWARVVVPGGGDGRGVAWLPEVNDEVLVAFEHGDARVPYVVGGLWSARAQPPLAATLVDATGRTAVRALRSRTGQRLVLSDENARTGATLVTGDDAMKVQLDGATTTVTVDSRGRVVVHGALDVQVTSDAKLLLEGRAGVEIKGATVAVTGQSAVTVKGAVIELN